MLSIAVCDDEIIECCQISKKIKKVLEEIKVPYIIQQFYNGKELLQESGEFDIIFLDILMNDLDGIKIAKLLRENYDKFLIFITSSREYSLEGYEVEAFQYFVKPLDEKKLKLALQRILKKTNESLQEFLIINEERQKKKLYLNSIYYFEIKGRIIYAYEEKKMTAFYEQIGNLEKNLKGKGFCRCHKSYLVNLKYVAGYNKKEVVLDNGKKVEIAKRRYEEFCKEVLEFIKENGGIM